MPGVYISYPFCGQKCTFCNFASGVFGPELEQQYISAIVDEIKAHRWQWKPDTVYLGGGTPSRMFAADVATVLGSVPGMPWVEATMEAAPGTLTRDGVRSWVAAGVNRVSLGVQSFITRELQRTGRRHTASTVAGDVELLRECGIPNFNIDLIAGLPFQTSESWEESLGWIEKLAPPHVSIYLFEIDEDSRLGLEVLNNGTRYGAGAVPSADEAADLYQRAVEWLANLGIRRYEISNFARPGAESRHNLKYWLVEPYAGFGADAHSFDGATRWGNVETAQDYVHRWSKGESVRKEPEMANLDEERFFVGLRLMQGIRINTTDESRHGHSIERFVTAGLLERNAEVLRLTSRGVLLSNEVFAEFLAPHD